MNKHPWSEGAQHERAAMRSRLVREIGKTESLVRSATLQDELAWVIARQKKYKKNTTGK